MDINQILTLVFSGIVAISTIVYAILTSSLVKETKATRLLQITPDVQIYLEKAETDAHLVYFIIENFGFGIASDVKFTFIKDFEFYESDRLRISNMGSFKHGLSSFYPRQRYKYFFTNLLTDFENKRNDNIEIQVAYKDIYNKKYERNFILGINEILGTGMMMTPPDSFLGRISHELSEINKKLEIK
jgi:hypothetical protein